MKDLEARLAALDPDASRSRLAGVPARCRTHAKRARQDIALLIEEKSLRSCA
jgi:hypothetical protein